MFPWTHAVFGYLLLLLVVAALGRQVSKAELVAVVVGTQVADLIDKPLAWSFQALPSGRSLGHSLLLAVPMVALVVGVAWYRQRTAVGTAFGLGYLSHLVGDVYVAVYYWRVEEFTFLLWPILPPYPYDDFVGFADFASTVELTGPLVGLFLASVGVGLVFLAHFARAPRWPTPRSS
jgi:membrane-bound metal-dependent hydrolase YbcI (DUF457 family)